MADQNGIFWSTEIHQKAKLGSAEGAWIGTRGACEFVESNFDVFCAHRSPNISTSEQNGRHYRICHFAPQNGNLNSVLFKSRTTWRACGDTKRYCTSVNWYQECMSVAGGQFERVFCTPTPEYINLWAKWQACSVLPFCSAKWQILCIFVVFDTELSARKGFKPSIIFRNSALSCVWVAAGIIRNVQVAANTRLRRVRSKMASILWICHFA